MKTIHLITGSTLGGAEYVADHLNEVLSAQGFSVALFNQATFDDIKSAENLLVVTSTHGAGELPENIQPLFADIAAHKPDFSQLKFGVIGLGSSDYDTFCNAVNIVTEHLITCGATAVCKPLKIDVTQNFDHDGTAEAWLPEFVAQI